VALALPLIHSHLNSDIDWEALVSKRIAAPWIPPIKDPLDTSNFDPYDENDYQIERYVETQDKWYADF
jgi:hypothetical protein